jgi:hypothetical protein
MISEWMKVMLEEIARKKAEAEQQRVEQQVRGDVIKSDSCAPEKNTCAREKTIGDAEQPRDTGRGRTRP